jgi:hypothetical protein
MSNDLYNTSCTLQTVQYKPTRMNALLHGALEEKGLCIIGYHLRVNRHLITGYIRYLNEKPDALKIKPFRARNQRQPLYKSGSCQPIHPRSTSPNTFSESF